MLYTSGVFTWHNVYNFNIYLLHALSAILHFKHTFATKLCNVIQIPIVSKYSVIWLHTVPAYHCKLVPSHSTVHWPCIYVCCLLAECTLGYRCRSLWIQTLYQRRFADHFQELWGQNHSWQLQGRHTMVSVFSLWVSLFTLVLAQTADKMCH